MELTGNEKKQWCFGGSEAVDAASAHCIRGVLSLLDQNLPKADSNFNKPTIPLGHGDPSRFPCFRTTPVAEDAVIDAVRSSNFNSYASSVGILPARRAIAENISLDIPHQLTSDDVFLTVGCRQAIEVTMAALGRPNANILLPRPGYPHYDAHAVLNCIETRHFDLLPENGWEVDLEAVKVLADENTLGMVIINPGNPCGNVYSYEHLKKVAETARMLGILVIADEVYGHLTFGIKEFVPMGIFGSIVPVISLGSISKIWLVPGWRLGWLVTIDPNGILKQYGILESIRKHLDISSDPATFIQGAVPHMINNTKEEFFSKIKNILRENADICYKEIQDIPSFTCPYKPEGSMFVMVKLNLSLLEDISDDMDFCLKLANAESVIVLPGVALGLKNWVRITFATEPSFLKEGLKRVKYFCQKITKPHRVNK